MSGKKEIRVKGSPVSEGIAIGIPYFLVASEDAIPEFPIAVGEVDGEIDRYRKALFSSREDLKQLQSDLTDEGSKDAAGIIDTHIQMLDDPLITTHMEEKIRQMRQNTEAVFRSVITEFETRFSRASNSFFQQRLIDVMDVSKRILGHLGNKQKISLCDIPESSVIIALELAPSQTAAVPASRVGAFVTQLGGGNSHAALIARAKGIPYVASVEIEKLQQVECDCVIVDGISGEIILNPSESTLNKYLRMQKCFQSRYEAFEKEAALKAVTSDGVPIRLFANAGALSELDMLEQHGAEGVGLFRTEYLLLAESSFIPLEEEQVAFYEKIVESMKGQPVVIRVFDIGGDKIPSLFVELEKEPNPVLGCRGIRFLLRHQDVFRTQLRALMRSAGSSDMRLLLPLIADIGELRLAKKLIEEVRAELKIKRTFPIGCMVEVPSAALITEALARESDFLSIGTNDLVQYTLGVDRSNPAMSELYYPAHPSVLRLIKMAVEQADLQGKHIGICGEIASNPLFVPLLMGLGIREFSCASRYLPFIKRTIREVSIESCTSLAKTALQMATSEEIARLLQDFHP